jgi:uncharacterized protein YjbI with pentapeptide repeats
MPEPIIAYWETLPAWIRIGLAVLAALMLAIAMWWLWWRLPKREAARLALKIRDAKARADVEDNYRKTVGQALGGIAVLLGAGSAYLQFSQQQRAAHDLLISNQVAKGFELLGNKDKDALVLRLGGIYALEGVMNGSEQYHQPVLEALCAFVREGAKLPAGPATSEQPMGNKKPSTDIQAALTVIGRRSVGPGTLNLTRTNIAGANLDRANLIGADLTQADLSTATLRAADLLGATLRVTDLSTADLSQAGLHRANLSGANLSGATLVATDLSNADMGVANLSGATLIDADLSAVKLQGASLFSANLTGANLRGADLSSADLKYADLIQQQLDAACGSNAALPPGLTLKPCPRR